MPTLTTSQRVKRKNEPAFTRRLSPGFGGRTRDPLGGTETACVGCPAKTSPAIVADWKLGKQHFIDDFGDAVYGGRLLSDGTAQAVGKWEWAPPAQPQRSRRVVEP